MRIKSEVTNVKNLTLGIAHAAYHTAQMDKMLDFYCNKLEFKHAFSIAGDNGEPWIEFVKLADGSFLEFFYASPERMEKNDDKWFTHTCIKVTDVDAVAEFLKSKGIELIIEPRLGKEGNPQCWCADPDGNPIEFMCIMPGSPQAQA
jgi:lactoylglutathione lyase